MGLIKKIADYIKKADDALTELAHDLKITGTNYKMEFATAYDSIRESKQRVDAVGQMTLGAFLREGLYELENIKESTIKSAKNTYANVKNITSNFFAKRKTKHNNFRQKTTKKQNNQYTNETQSNLNLENSKKLVLDDIIKKEELEKIKGGYKKIYETNELKYVEKQPRRIKKPKLTYNLTNSYKTNITNILNTYNSNISSLAQTISGKQKLNNKKIWKWTDRINSFKNQLNKTNYSNKDVRGLEQIKQTINSNRYLKKNHADIANEIITELDNIINLYK